MELRKYQQYICDECEFVTVRLRDYNRHMTSSKHLYTLTKKQYKYNCEECEFKTNREYDYIRHNESAKHIEMSKLKIYTCIECSKKYSQYNSYWYHRSKCCPTTEDEQNAFSPFISLDTITQHDIFKQLMAEQNEQMTSKMSELHHIVNDINGKMDDLSSRDNITYNTNNHFNLNLFLNVYCKDAMNLSDFMNSIDIQLHELEYIGKHGYVAGITKIITSRLSAMDICKRPIHCSDLRREVLHIRENNEWIKDIDGEKTRAFIYNVNIINYKSIGKWMIAHPKCEVLDTPEYNQWFSIAKQSVNPGEGKENRNNTIFKNVIKFCHIDKPAFRVLNFTHLDI